MATLADELTALKTEEDKITGNKVANFSYDDYAYEHNDANGVDTYNVDNHQNIPNGTANILKVNATILTKGWRAQASAITRMLMNHFLGRCSYNLNKINDHFSALLAKLIAYIGQPNGLATLDANGIVTASQIKLYKHTITITYNATYHRLGANGNIDYRTEKVDIINSKSTAFTEAEMITQLKGKFFINGMGYSDSYIASGNVGMAGKNEFFSGITFSNDVRPRASKAVFSVYKSAYATPPASTPEISFFMDMAMDSSVYITHSTGLNPTVVTDPVYTDTVIEII